MDDGAIGGGFFGGFGGDPYGGGYGTTVVDYGPGFGGMPVGVPNCCCSLI